MQCWSSDRELLVGLRVEWGEGAGERNEFVSQMNMHVVQLVLHGLEENCVAIVPQCVCACAAQHCARFERPICFGGRDGLIRVIVNNSVSVFSQGRIGAASGAGQVCPFLWLALRP